MFFYLILYNQFLPILLILHSLGTLGFMAPEIFDEKYDEKVDIYAFGMLMLEVMTNRTPYDECETVLQVAAKTMSGQGPDIMQMVSNPSLREVISACIQPLTCFRPTADELYFHPLFQVSRKYIYIYSCTLFKFWKGLFY